MTSAFLYQRFPPGLSDSRASQKAALPQWRLLDAIEHLRPFVADVAGFNGRLAELRLSGPDIWLSTAATGRLIPALAAVLRHMVLHRVEDPLTRLCAGKSPVGSLSVVITVRNATLTISIKDDGKAARDDGLAGCDGLTALAARLQSFGLSLNVGSGSRYRLGMSVILDDDAVAVTAR